MNSFVYNNMRAQKNMHGLKRSNCGHDNIGIKNLEIIRIIKYNRI